MFEKSNVIEAATHGMTEPAPNPELLASLGRLVRGLSAIFWGLPIGLVVCVQTAKGDLLRPLGAAPPIVATALLFYGLGLLGHFQKQERVWRAALDRARVFALINLGLSPFLFWWNQVPSNRFFNSMIELMALTTLIFLFALNPVLCRLTAMLPDETLRQETKLFTTVNRLLLTATIMVVVFYFVLARINQLPPLLIVLLSHLERAGLWLATFLILLPVAMTMALVWKTKEVILAGVFGPEH
jgi:hypothetical protein